MTMDTKQTTLAQLEAGLNTIRQSPKDEGRIELIVKRPGTERREALETAQLDLADGLVGDNWRRRGSFNKPSESPNPDTQLTLMNARVIALLAQQKDRWQLAGDQLFVDMDLSKENLPAGTRLAVGSAVIEVTSKPHTGCDKFAARFGLDALKFVNSQTGKMLQLRGINARIVQPGEVRVGDTVRKI